MRDSPGIKYLHLFINFFGLFQTMESEFSVLLFAITTILLLIGFFFLLSYLLFKKRQKEQHKRIAELNEQMMQSQIEIQEQTLKNVSQEIHDNVGQVLSLAKLNLATFNPTSDSKNQTKLEETRKLLTKAISDLRDLARSMHGEKISEIGLQVAVDNELKFIQNTGIFETSLTVTGNPRALPPQAQTVLFRIIQEALHNDVKHSKAKRIDVRFEYSERELLLTVIDDGVGFDAELLKAADTGIGLKNMKNRAALVGAEFFINSKLHSGTTIGIRIPITE